MRTLLIDNYDSFTFNLHQLLWEVSGVEPLVVRNDAASWEELERLEFDAVVLSPGPGRPERERDFGVCAEAIRRCRAPLLGVCLGHQGIGWTHGGEVVPAPRPLHGRVAAIEHRGAPLFAGIPPHFQATRYHSLALARPLPDCLEEIATAEDGVPMAVAHRDRPQWGVQFHPESIATEHGRRLLENFRDLAVGLGRGTGARRTSGIGGRGVPCTERGGDDPGGSRSELRLAWRRLEVLPDAERLFATLYAASRNAFWLDSNRPGPHSRFTFMGDDSGPLAAVVTYDASATEVERRSLDALTTPGCGKGIERRREPILDYLDGELRRVRAALADGGAELPFGFECGFAGYLGYEVKAECGSATAHRSPHPDAAFVFADRLFALDHDRGHTYLLCLHERGGEQQASAWLDRAATDVRRVMPATGGITRRASAGSAGGERPELRLVRSRQRYLAEIERCRELLEAGESYEICLTNRVEAELAVDPLELYGRLRRANPAPFGAYLRFGDLAILSSSPERFLAVDRKGGAEARPIKGTSRRDADPDEDARLAAALAADPKNRAENLMIADLLRNDLGSVCEVGSVEAPSLFGLESYETVHQLVSVVRSRLRRGLTAADAVRACFPPGSMTGAPKLRTVEILERLEGAARGVYSGAIGWFGAGGAADLSVAIRTLVLERAAPGAAWNSSAGAGGAIVLDSDPETEFEEMLLKAAAALRAVDPTLEAADISLPDRGLAELTSPPAPFPT